MHKTTITVIHLTTFSKSILVFIIKSYIFASKQNTSNDCSTYQNDQRNGCIAQRDTFKNKFSATSWFLCNIFLFPVVN